MSKIASPTGREPSSPEFQFIRRYSPEATSLRDAVAKKERPRLLDADFSTIEKRVLAHMVHKLPPAS